MILPLYPRAPSKACMAAYLAAFCALAVGQESKKDNYSKDIFKLSTTISSTGDH